MLRPRGQTDPEAKILASASTSWPQPRVFGLGLDLFNLASKKCYPVQNNIDFIHFFSFSYDCSVNCGWNRLCSQTVGIGHSNVGIKKFIYVLLSLSPCVLIQKYLHVASALILASKTWPRPQPRGSVLSLGVSSSASVFWPHLTHIVLVKSHSRCRSECLYSAS